MDELQKQVLNVLFPDGKFSPEGVQTLNEFLQKGQQADQTIIQPRLTPAERIDLKRQELETFEPFQESATNRVLEGARVGTELSKDKFKSQMQDYTTNLNSTLGLGYDSLDRGQQRYSDDLRYLIDNQSGHKDKDRELRSRAQTMNMIKSGIGGGLLLLDILRN